MKSVTLIGVMAALALFPSLVACRKSVDSKLAPGNPRAAISDSVSNGTSTDTLIVAYPKQTTSKCPNAPDYGDSIFFIQPGASKIAPINHPDTGTYFAWPVGIVIDKKTGVIDLSKSETGMRYSIGYVRKGSTDTCMQTLILAGISYEDSLYVLNDNQRYAKPYYNANPNQAPVCSGSGVPGGGACQFDINGQAAKQSVIIDDKSGFIDLKNTASKAFGILPVNGTTVTVKMEYKLDDNSNKAMQRITFKLIYYNRKADVPADLLAAVTDKLNKIINQVLLINIPGTGGQQTFAGNPRPPIIIVTRYN